MSLTIFAVASATATLGLLSRSIYVNLARFVLVPPLQIQRPERRSISPWETGPPQESESFPGFRDEPRLKFDVSPLFCAWVHLGDPDQDLQSIVIAETPEVGVHPGAH
jgi:hypothetical protein